jgi:hypothetical protein
MSSILIVASVLAISFASMSNSSEANRAAVNSIKQPSPGRTQGQVKWIKANIRDLEAMTEPDLCQSVTKQRKVGVDNIKVDDAEDTLSVTAESDSQGTFPERPSSALLIAVQIRR